MLRSSGGSPPCPRPTSEAERPAPGDIPRPRAGADEPKGCLFALSQPPLMLFLCVIAGLIGFGALYDIVML
ncbi:hypothetical protein [Streptomyces sp. RKAG293]|uniref:hypothetical protein n=1 Tax=Streptomyces sp. RKAG293 TaxID=2893403 RepID=UPI0020336600|nr:hypothetical protein [Streptomyces sp. RKAG293]MCM2418323.1 hypothetical protein [Streptomyces sp. RKAG293]